MMATTTNTTVKLQQPVPNMGTGTGTSIRQAEPQQQLPPQQRRRRFEGIPQHLRIRVLYADDAIVVIDKPNNLRSVPGNARNPSLRVETNTHHPTDDLRLPPRRHHHHQTTNTTTKTTSTNTITNETINRSATLAPSSSSSTTSPSSPPPRLTAVEAWQMALREYPQYPYHTSLLPAQSIPPRILHGPLDDTTDPALPTDHDLDAFIHNILVEFCSAIPTRSLVSVPRKYHAFQRFLRQRSTRWSRPPASATPSSAFLVVPQSQPTNHHHSSRRQPTNKHHLLDCDQHHQHPYMNDHVIQGMFHRLKQLQIKLMNLPEPTLEEESAFGQLLLLGYGSDLAPALPKPTTTTTTTTPTSNTDPDINPLEADQYPRHHPASSSAAAAVAVAPQLFIVHRLDCETSGVMVFARTTKAASFLCQAWRQREEVRKWYRARVWDWSLRRSNPAIGSANEEENNEVTCNTAQKVEGWQTIDLPLCPHEQQALLWRVCSADTPGAKKSITLWRVLKEEEDAILMGSVMEANSTTNPSHPIAKNCNNGIGSNDITTLELQPITGRTHQLRIHCAAVGGGIVGDRFYGASSTTATTTSSEPNGILYLHAYRLQFPHPTTHQLMDFTVPPNHWQIHESKPMN